MASNLTLGLASLVRLFGITQPGQLLATKEWRKIESIYIPNIVFITNH